VEVSESLPSFQSNSTSIPEKTVEFYNFVVSILRFGVIPEGLADVRDRSACITERNVNNLAFII